MRSPLPLTNLYTALLTSSFMPLFVRVLAVGAAAVFFLAFLKVSRNSHGALTPQADSTRHDSTPTWNASRREVRTATEAARDSFDSNPADMYQQVEDLSARYTITSEEISDVSNGDSVFDVIVSLRPEWLTVDGNPREIRVRVDGQRVGGVEVLRNIRRELVSHIRYAPWEKGGPEIQVSFRR